MLTKNVYLEKIYHKCNFNYSLPLKVKVHPIRSLHLTHWKTNFQEIVLYSTNTITTNMRSQEALTYRQVENYREQSWCANNLVATR